MQVRYRYRIYPSPGQQKALTRAFGCARVVYNDCLRVRDEAYAAGEKISDTEVQRRVITLAKATPERAWLAGVASVALVQACQDARRAYKNWFESLKDRRKGPKIRHPKPRRKRGRQSIRLTRNGFALHGERLYVAKVGDLKVESSRALPSVPSSVTVIGEPDGRYYASFVVQREPEPLPACDREVGVDLGLASLVVTSDGEVVANPRFFRAAQPRLRRAQRVLSRRRKGSANRAKAGIGSRYCTAGFAIPGSITRTRRLFGWSATTKRSTPKTCACPGLCGHGWPSRSPIRLVQLLRCIAEKAARYGRTFAKVAGSSRPARCARPAGSRTARSRSASASGPARRAGPSMTGM